MNVSRRIERWSPLVVLAIALMLWQFVVWAFGIAEFIFPSPTQIAKDFVEFRGPLLEAAGPPSLHTQKPRTPKEFPDGDHRFPGPRL